MGWLVSKLKLKLGVEIGNGVVVVVVVVVVVGVVVVVVCCCCLLLFVVVVIVALNVHIFASNILLN